MKRFGIALAVAAIVTGGSAASVSNTDEAVVHALNRIGYGARVGDVERVRTLGVQRYVDQQLHPERVPDPAMADRLSALTTIGMSSQQIRDEFELPQLEARRERKNNAKTDEDTPRMPDPRRKNANSLVVELSEQKLLRATYSERQLQEVLTDFWFNHFNVDARKGRDRFLLTEYEREAIRPRVLGKFRDLLEATARSPAMLFYLDNWMSAQEGSGGSKKTRPTSDLALPTGRAPRGLNENYGRELMELHTLGVDGGYTQKDVTEVARAFTGWTIENPRQGSGFTFEPRLHDPGEKTVLGHRIKPGGGIQDGEQVLDILSKHPSTARFISTKLVRRFVSDTPPTSLVDRAAARFRDTNGDLREVMRTILTSSEFLSPAAYNAKVKTPFEFVVSALRATDADVRDARPFVRTLQQLGMPLYQCQPPTGYKDTADAWINTGALVARMNVALTLSKEDEKLALRIGAPEFQRR